MALNTFFGGIHPYDGKRLTKGQPVRTVFPEMGEAVYPLIQHVGSMAVPVVRPGDYVRTGQLIAEADGELSANVHSSVSGYVTAVENRKTASGEFVPSIVVQNDGVFLEIMYPEDRRLDSLTLKTVIGAVRRAGVVGMGGSGMPADVKIRDAANADVDTVIANCVECEPYLTSDYRRILENPWKIIGGLMVLLRVFPGARGYIAVSSNNTKGYQRLKDLVKDEPRIFVKKVDSKYPQGSERQLIYAITGRKLNARMLPHDIGCLVHNTDTLVAIYQAVIMHEPLITRIITVSGDGAALPGNFRARIGMSYRDLLEQAGGFKSGLDLDDVMVLDGGPMMGTPVQDLEVPVTKRTTALIVMKRSSVAARKETPCTRCGRCVASCPNHLIPLILYQDVTGGKESRDTDFIQHNGMECCGCGCCSYSCPSGIDLSAVIRAKKDSIMKDPVLAGDYARRRARL